jgi:1,4-dihydroxy-2-naphthoate octaprenyltransferase
MTEKNQTNLFYHIRPIHLTTVLALYLAGAGLARYLGARLNFLDLGLGFLWLLCLFLGLFLLGDYLGISFESPLFPVEHTMTADQVQNQSAPSQLLLFGALALLSAAGILTLLIGLRGVIGPPVAVVMVLIFGLSASVIIPRLNLKYSGIGEFIISLNLALLPPALAFFTQYGEFHRFLTFSFFPVFPLHLALILTLRLRSYALDYRFDRKTLMVRLGWVKGVFLHNLLILSAFVLFGVAMLFGLPVRIVGPVFLALVPAGYLIWIYSGLEHGAPVRWPVIIFLSLVVFFMPVYLIAFTVWIF